MAAWLVLEAASLSAIVPRECCLTHSTSAPASEQKCHEPVSERCVMRASCDGPMAGLLTLIANLGIPTAAFGLLRPARQRAACVVHVKIRSAFLSGPTPTSSRLNAPAFVVGAAQRVSFCNPLCPRGGFREVLEGIGACRLRAGMSRQVANAQQPGTINQGTISGRVTDASGAVVPGATVTARQTETNLIAETQPTPTAGSVFHICGSARTKSSPLPGFRTTRPLR